MKFPIRGLIVSLTWLLLAAIPAAAHEIDCVPNGTFEAAAGEPAQVVQWGEIKAPNAWEILDGNRVLRATAPHRLQWDMPDRIVWNTEYELTARVKGQDVKNFRLCLWAQLPDKHEPPAGPKFSRIVKGSFDWQTLSIRLRMPEGATRFTLFIDQTKDGGTVWLDDLSLKPVDIRPLPLATDAPSYGLSPAVREQLTWIWHEPGFPWQNPNMGKDVNRPVPEATVLFRRSIEVPADAIDPQVTFTADDFAELRVNEQDLGRNQTVQDVARRALRPHLVPGRNTITFRVPNRAGPAGLLARIDWKKPDGGRTVLATNAGWECSIDDGQTWKPAAVVAAPAPAPTQFHWAYPHLEKLSYRMSYPIPADATRVRVALRATGSLALAADDSPFLSTISSGRIVRADITDRVKSRRQLSLTFEDICQPPGGQGVLEITRGKRTEIVPLSAFRADDGKAPEATPLVYSERTWPLNVGAFEAAVTRPEPDLHGRLEPWAVALLEGSTRLFEVGTDDNSSAEFGPIDAGAAEAVVLPTPDAGVLPRGLEAKLRPDVTIHYQLGAVPTHGAALVLDVEDADAMVTTVGVFSNGIFVGNPQILGYDQLPGRRLTNRAWVVTIPASAFQLGENTLTLRILPSLYRSPEAGAENQAEEYIRSFNLGERKDNPYPTSSWVHWDQLYLSALARPAAEPINGRPVWMGTNIGYTHLKGIGHWRDYVLRDMSYLGMEESQSPVRFGMSIDPHFRQMTATDPSIPDGKSVGDEMLGSMRSAGLRPYLILDAGRDVQSPDEIPASHEAKVLKRFGQYIDMLEIGNEIDSPYYAWDAQRLGAAYATIQRQAAVGQALKQFGQEGMRIMGEGWYHAWDFSVIDAQARQEADTDPAWTDALSGHDYGNSYIIPAATYYLLYGVNPPKEIWITECGAFTKDDADIHAFDLNLRGNIAFASHVVQYLMHPYSTEMRRFSMFSAQAADAQVLEKARSFRRLLHAYAKHGKPLAWRWNNPSKIAHQPVLINAIETEGAIKISFINFSSAPQPIDATITLPASGEFQAIRYGDGATVAEGTRNVALRATPDLHIQDTLAAGETVEYLIRKPRQAPPVAAAPIAPRMEIAHQPFDWKNVAIGGGGYVTDVYLHPGEKDLVYLRTDVGGFYRLDAAGDRWIPITDHFTRQQRNYYGGEGLALDPNDPNIVYIACGRQTASWAGKGALFKSTDRGAKWTQLPLKVPMGGNDDYRWAGPRLVVAPGDSNTLFFASRKDGLFRSTDAGANWSPVKLEAKFRDNIGVASLAFDADEPRTIYANAYGDAIYRSTDLGQTWQKLQGSPANALRMASAPGEVLYITTESGVVKMTGGAFQSIAPPGTRLGFCGVAVNPASPQEVLITAIGQKSTPHYRSTDGGKTWAQLKPAARNMVPWQSDHFFNSNVSGLAYDPHYPGRAWFTDWYGVWTTDNVAQDPVIWRNIETGHEELVVFSMIAPPGGPLLSGSADVDGFAHDNGPDAFPSRTFSHYGQNGPWMQHTLHLAYCAAQPRHVVRVGGNPWNKSWFAQGSSDGGITWKQIGSFPAMPVRVAISATDPQNIVVICGNAPARVTMDGGATWKIVKGLPNGPNGPWYWSHPLAADSVKAGTFYFQQGGMFWKSSDGGASFQLVNPRLIDEGWSMLHAAPGVAEELWMSQAGHGLIHSRDGGASFTRIPSVQHAHLIALGAPRKGTDVPTLYLYGTPVGASDGIYLSTDRAVSWTRIDAPAVPVGCEPNSMAADQGTFGTIYIGTNGRGIFVGKVQAD